MDMRKHTIVRFESDLAFEFILKEGDDPKVAARKQLDAFLEKHKESIDNFARVSTYTEEWDEDEQRAKDPWRWAEGMRPKRIWNE